MQTIWHYHLAFQSRPDGADLRNRQIDELLRNTGQNVQDISPTLAFPADAVRAARGLLWIGGRGELQTQRKYLAAQLRPLMEAQRTSFRAGDLFVFNCAGQIPSEGLRSYLRNLGVGMVSTPHNVEALIRPPRTRADYRALRVECEGLRSGLGCFAISATDVLLLRLMGIEAKLLPYWPSKSRMNLFTEIRRDRISSSKKFILILGTATNSPTGLGMRLQLDWISSWRNSDEPLHFIIVGKGTETLGSSDDRVTFAGRVTDETLRRLFIDAQALWVHQPPTTGALTRVMEAILCGLPVIINAGCLTETNPSTVLRYSEKESGLSLLRRAATIPMPPTPEKPDTSEFLKAVQSYMESGSAGPRREAVAQ